MTSKHQQEQRFASFTLQGETSIEMAIAAEKVLEATRITGAIQPLPAGAPYLEGFMHLRDDAIPVINMKKRLGLLPAQYRTDAKVAVVTISNLRFGLLFDDIKEVVMVDGSTVHPVHPTLQTEEGIISDLIKLDQGRRIIELLDLQRLLGQAEIFEQIRDADLSIISDRSSAQENVSRHVVFSCKGQEYGVPVEKVQEITFFSKIDDVFKNDAIEGVVQLRGQSIPVLNAAQLLGHHAPTVDEGEATRVLILKAETFQYGLLVDRVCEILTIPDSAMMTLPGGETDTVSGIYQRPDSRNLMLIQVDGLIEGQKSQLKSVFRLKTEGHDINESKSSIQSRHLITADCYLIFSIGKNFAIALKDVQEIIEPKELMALPLATGYDRQVLNLRGTVVPVINMRGFFGWKEEATSTDKKLIVARSRENVIALEVDQILTIYKQVQYHLTPSLNPQLARRKDTLDRLIEFVGETGVKEHVLVINVQAMMDNHLNINEALISTDNISNIKEYSHDNHAAE